MHTRKYFKPALLAMVDYPVAELRGIKSQTKVVPDVDT
jgi:hypothetical protein